MSRISPEQLRHFLAVNLLWKTAKEKLYERFGEAPPEIILTQFDTDRETWDAEEIEISAFLGKLSALAGENGWIFQIKEGFYDCLVPYLFGAVSDLPKHIDGKAAWPCDCECTVSEELMEELPGLLLDTFGEYYTPAQVCFSDDTEDEDDTQVKAFALFPKEGPSPEEEVPYDAPYEEDAHRVMVFHLPGYALDYGNWPLIQTITRKDDDYS